MVKSILHNFVSFILPVTVLILVPDWLTGFIPVNSGWLIYLGTLLLGIGTAMLITTVVEFIRKGKGTLAPWKPTTKLVVTGLHTYVRNPMILGVCVALAGESILFYSSKIFCWLIIFFIINHFYFVYFEEPLLLKKFGSEYEAYKKNVHRWIPRRHGFKPG